MAEEVKMSEVIDEIKNATENELTEVIEEWFRKTRTDGMRLGAQLKPKDNSEKVDANEVVEEVTNDGTAE